jgi:hypothetical protein
MSAALNDNYGSGLDQPFLVTFFRDVTAEQKSDEYYTLRSLAPRVQAITASEKTKLPLLKLAKFGDIRTVKNSLRSDDNMQEIYGVEADYDEEAFPVADAVEKLEKAGILAMLYTSPRHTEDTPRWRVLCPTTGPLPRDQRTHLLGRLNGLFGGIFGDESFTLSQSYYYGSLNHNPSHQVHLIEGTPIDEHDDLDEIWIGKSNTGESKASATGERTSGPLDEAEILLDLISGTNYHQGCVRLLGRWARFGIPYMEARQRLLNAFDAVAPELQDRRWATRRGDVDRCLNDIYGKEAKKKDQREILSDNITGRAGSNHSDKASDDDGTSFGDDAEQTAGPEQKQQRGQAHGRLRVLSVDDIDTIPDRDYLLKGLMSPEEFSLWVGAPKCGKSFLMLYVSYMLSLGISVFGRRVKPTKVLYVAAEGEGGIAKRIRALRDRFGRSPDFHYIAQPANLLHVSGHTADLTAAATAYGAQLIVLDTLSRVLAGGDENSPKDMGTLIANVGDIRYKTKAHVAVIHHGTKASEGRSPRGHGNLDGAYDALVEVVKTSEGKRYAKLVKAKDDADGVQWDFDLDIVNLGTDEDGDVITTLIVNEKKEAATAKMELKNLTKNEQLALSILDKAIKAESTLVGVGEDGAERPVVAEAIWRKWFYAEALADKSQDTKEQAFRRAGDGLETKGQIIRRNNFVWRPDVW